MYGSSDTWDPEAPPPPPAAPAAAAAPMPLLRLGLRVVLLREFQEGALRAAGGITDKQEIGFMGSIERVTVFQC